ncbi:MAG TPA: 3-phosphoshikimate 1-carboxyvinyltransferase [Nocardioides sp.]|uniref:3-phosphoshikimate 1-carboxyvinyltransferase n=1 Tax=Nocardioides sp. TaxID=35761 RepID=UPI002E351CAB|nr:3-phosphoshikimate 1-carboxyvinyltransferase [Nocardioides sp.]HEX3929311.1 3-phosphoshikimate 1-carboxyvinyltransferase [Nocardioides sp.]
MRTVCYLRRRVGNSRHGCAPPAAPAQTGTVIVTIAGPSALRGTVRVPGDKSISHRALMMAALAPGTSRVTGLSDGDDVRRTLAAISALGAEVTDLDGVVEVTGGSLAEPVMTLDHGNSGTGIRLMTGIAAGLPFRTRLDGDDSVRSRPMERIATPLRLMGARVEGRDGGYAPLVVDGGGLRGIEYTTPVASAQIKSAILLAGLSAEGMTTVHEPAVSRRHTEEMLAARGAPVVVEGTTTSVTPSTLSPLDTTVAADPSQAAFWLATAAALPGSELTVPGVYLGPARRGFLDVLLRMGADLVIEQVSADSYDVTARGSALEATDVEPGEVPGLVDEIPVLAVAAALAEGTTRFRGAGELRVKETDRLATVTAMLRALGVTVVEHPDGLDVTGGRLGGGTVDSFGDHRIAMAAAMAAVAAREPVTVLRFDAVATSYPGFLDDLGSCAAGVVLDPGHDA